METCFSALCDFGIEDTIPLSRASIVSVERLGVNQTYASLKVVFYFSPVFFFKVCSLFSILIYYVVSGCGLRFNYLACKILKFLKLKINIYIYIFCSGSAEIFSTFCSYFFLIFFFQYYPTLFTSFSIFQFLFEFTMSCLSMLNSRYF